MDSQGLPDLSRVVVVGTSCSGKTTFARNLAEHLDVDHIEMDALYWLPGWVEREPAEFLRLVDQRTESLHWVADGNFEVSQDLLWSRATAVIWLDYSFPLIFWRSIVRTFRRVITGETCCGENRESWRIAFFSRHSILLWIISTYPERRQRYSALFAGADYAHAAKIRLSKPAEATAFLRSIKKP